MVRKTTVGATPSTIAVALVMATAGLVTVGCSAPPRAPEEAVGEWCQALANNDAGSAWRLLSAGARERVGRDTVVARVRAAGDEARALERSAATTGEVATVASWPGEHGDIGVVDDGGGWRIRSGVLGLYGDRTPRQALVSFVEAYGRGRWDVIHRLAPRVARRQLSPSVLRERLAEEDMREHLEPRVEALRTALVDRSRKPEVIRAAGDAGGAESVGARAELPYGPFRARLIREPDGWRVEDL